MAEDLILEINIEWLGWSRIEEKRAYLLGVMTGLNIAEHMQMHGILTMPVSIHHFLTSKWHEKIDLDRLVREMTPFSMRKPFHEECFVGSQYLNQAGQYFYLHGALLGFSRLFLVLATYINRVNGIFINDLMEQYLRRVRRDLAEMMLTLEEE